MKTLESHLREAESLAQAPSLGRAGVQPSPGSRKAWRDHLQGSASERVSRHLLSTYYTSHGTREREACMAGFFWADFVYAAAPVPP